MQNPEEGLKSTIDICYCSRDENRGKKSVRSLGFYFRLFTCFIVFLVINQWSMLHVMDCEYWLCLLMFMKNVTTCSFGFVFVYGHFVCRGHCVSQWSHSGPKFVLGFNFSVCMCYLVRQNQ